MFRSVWRTIHGHTLAVLLVPILLLRLVAVPCHMLVTEHRDVP